MKRDMAEVRERIQEARSGLIEQGFHCLSGGPFGLPSYTDVEAWADGHGTLLYLLYDTRTGGWDLLRQLDRSNTIQGTWQAVKDLLAATA